RSRAPLFVRAGVLGGRGILFSFALSLARGQFAGVVSVVHSERRPRRTLRRKLHRGLVQRGVAARAHFARADPVRALSGARLRALGRRAFARLWNSTAR